jgi:branched-subunit amino acid transport protein
VETFLTFFGMALATFFTRYTMMVALGREIPPMLRRWLGYVPPAVLAALIVPAVLAPQGTITIGLPFWATLAAAVVAWRSRNVLLTILSGMAAFWALKLIGL